MKISLSSRSPYSLPDWGPSQPRLLTRVLVSPLARVLPVSLLARVFPVVMSASAPSWPPVLAALGPARRPGSACVPSVGGTLRLGLTLWGWRASPA